VYSFFDVGVCSAFIFNQHHHLFKFLQQCRAYAAAILEMRTAQACESSLALRWVLR
jgi:hypothetical protein